MKHLILRLVIALGVVTLVGGEMPSSASAVQQQDGTQPAPGKKFVDTLFGRIEVDLSDPEDIKVVANDAQGAVLVHLGSSNFLDRYKVYVAHVQEWRSQFERLDSVDLRYDRQIIVNPDLRGVGKQAPLSATAARVAAAAGVKKAALLTRDTPLNKPRSMNLELRSAGQPRAGPYLGAVRIGGGFVLT